MVGSALKTLLPKARTPPSTELDLTYLDELRQYFHDNGSEIELVYHLAAKVGGVKANSQSNAAFFNVNTLINTNLLETCRCFDVPKVVSVMSTCVYPDAPYVSYPLTETQLHNGPPHPSNFGYAYAKRMLDVQSRAIREQYGLDYVTVIPNNIYGPNDLYTKGQSHVIPALVRKVFEARESNAPTIEVWGDGTALREFTYSKDIAKILVKVAEDYNSPEPLNIGNTEEVSIRELVTLICDTLGYKGTVMWNTSEPSGQARKPTSNANLLSLGLWDKKSYTPLHQGIKETCDWFEASYPNIRGF